MALPNRKYVSLPNEENYGLEHNNQNLIGTRYNPKQKPPNLDLARKHGKANRVYLARDKDNSFDEQEICPCCGLPVEGEPIPLTADLDKLHHVGVSYALYFKLIKYIIAMLLIIFFVSGFYNLVKNLSQEKPSDCNDFTIQDFVECTEGFISHSSYFARIFDAHDKLQAILSLITTVLLIIFTQYMSYQIKKSQKQAESKTLKASDYTICIENMPLGATEEELIQWLKSFETADQSVKVHRVIWPYMINDNTRHCSVAFISFEEVAHADYIRGIFKNTFKNFMKIFHDKSLITRKLFSGKKVSVSRAPEPRDILWENLGCKKSTALAFCIALAQLGLILIPFFLIIQLDLQKTQAKNWLGKGSFIPQILPIIIPVFVLIISAFLAFPVAYLVRLNKPYNYTSFMGRFMRLYTVMLFLNLAVASFCAESGFFNMLEGFRQPWRDKNTFSVNNTYWMILVIALITPFLPLFDVSYLYKLYRRFFKASELTQEEVHCLFEGSTMDLATRFASITSMIFMTCFYSLLMPIGIIFTIISLIVQYWIDKYLLLRRHKLPKPIGRNFIKDIFLFFELWLALTFSIGNILTFSRSAFSHLALEAAYFISGIPIILALSSLIQQIFPIDYQASETKTFNEAKPHFITDYDLENPSTKKETLMQQFIRNNSDQESNDERL